jgi:hypothetical protein
MRPDISESPGSGGGWKTTEATIEPGCFTVKLCVEQRADG